MALPDYDATTERIFKFTVEAFGWNCPQRITQRYTLAEVKQAAVLSVKTFWSCLRAF